MNEPNQHASLPIDVPTLQPYGNAFDILITSVDDNLPVDSVCLFSNITDPDVISRVEGGACSFCFGDRVFCPGCIILS